MKLTLDPQLQEFVEERTRSGGYASPEDVIRAAFPLLKQQEETGNFAPGELDALLMAGEESIAREGTLDGDEAFEARRRRRSEVSSKAG